MVRDWLDLRAGKYHFQHSQHSPCPPRDGVAPSQKTLGSIMSELEHDRVDVIKVDIEGSELLALEQASTALVDKVRAKCEFGP